MGHYPRPFTFGRQERVFLITTGESAQNPNGVRLSDHGCLSRISPKRGFSELKTPDPFRFPMNSGRSRRLPAKLK